MTTLSHGLSLGTSATFMISSGATGSCTVSTNIPTGAGRNVSTNLTINKSVGAATARTLDVDYVEVMAQLDASR